MRRLLVTGAAGLIGSILRRTLRGAYSVRLSDLTPIETSRDEEFVGADLRDLDAVREAMKGVHGVVHLGGTGREAPWIDILGNDILGTYNIFEAARLEGVERVVYPSSVHAVGFYPRGLTLGVGEPVRPDSRYGLAKCFGEAAGSLYADKHGLRVLCIRIGNAHPKPVDERRLSIWISERDLTQLVRIGLEHPDLRYEIVYGASANKRSWWDNSTAFKLGYKPEDDSERFIAEEDFRLEPEDRSSPSYRYQGGAFVELA